MLLLQCILSRRTTKPTQRHLHSTAVAMAIIEVLICSSSSSSSNASWAGARQNQQNDICALQRLRSAWASTQSNKLLRCALNGSKVSPCEQRRLRSDWADAKADLSLRLAHRSFWCFCRVAAHLLCIVVKQYPGTCKQIISGCYGQCRAAQIFC